MTAFGSRLPPGILTVRIVSSFNSASTLLVAVRDGSGACQRLSSCVSRLGGHLHHVDDIKQLAIDKRETRRVSVCLSPRHLSRCKLGRRLVTNRLFTGKFIAANKHVRAPRCMLPIRIRGAFGALCSIRRRVICDSPSNGIIHLRSITHIIGRCPRTGDCVGGGKAGYVLLDIRVGGKGGVMRVKGSVSHILRRFGARLPSRIGVFHVASRTRIINSDIGTFLHRLIVTVITMIVIIVLLLPLQITLMTTSAVPIAVFVSLKLFCTFNVRLGAIALTTLVIALKVVISGSVIVVSDCLRGVNRKVSH